MLLVSCFSNERNAMCDMYKNIINAMPHKKSIVVIVPYAYEEDEFSNEFAYRVKEDVTSIKSKGKRLFYMAKYMYLLRQKLKPYNIRYIYFQNDVFLYNIILSFLYRKKVSYTLWLHDPVLHEGVCNREKIYRSLSMKTYFKTIKTFIVSYHAALNLINDNNLLNKYKSNMQILQLPQMPELEFPAIKEKKDIYLYDFIFFGRIEIYKGLELFLNAFKEISSKKLLIVGKGNDETKIADMISDDKRITFINRYVTNQELAWLIKSARCVVLPYKSATGSQTISIANYYDRIVMATKVGCFPEYIEEGKNGFFIEDYTIDAMKSALEKADYYINKCTPERIKSVYDKFDIDKIATQLYSKIVF